MLRRAALGLVLVTACSKEPPPVATAATATPQETPPSPAQAPAAGIGLVDPSARAAIGSAAPDFTLKDLDGNDVKLSSFRGKVVVLEWFNPGCPFVKNAHTKGSLVHTAKRHTKEGVVWLAVNSGAAGKQGHGVEANREGAKRFGMSHPILVDETGVVGRAYGATNTPHMYVIDAKGALAYRGAIDNSPDGEGESPTGGKLVNYVDAAIEAIGAGKQPANAEAKAYGCSVKYAK